MKLFTALTFAAAMTFGFTPIAMAGCGQCAKKAPHSHEKHCQKECKDAKNKDACQKKCIKEHDAKQKKKKK